MTDTGQTGDTPMTAETGFTGRTALVTGASRGIAAAIAGGLAAAGARVVISYSAKADAAAGHAGAAEALVAEITQAGGQAMAIESDIAEPGAPERLIADCAREIGVIDTLVPDLLNGDLDIICVSLDFPNRPEIAKQPLINVRHVLIADPSHPLAKRRDLSPAAIHGYPWMMLRSDYVGNERIASFFATHGLSPPNIAFETTSIHSLLQGLRNGHYIAHVPDRMLPLANSMGLEELRLNQTIWETPAGVAWRTGARPSASIQKFMTILSEQTS